jgi:type IV pilus assembly protein PilQ
MQRKPRGQRAAVPILLLVLGVAAGCATHSTTVASAGATGGDSASVLNGATLIADGETPRLLLSANGRLTPTVYARDSQTRIVVDLPNTVAAPGLEPPRADGTVLSKVEMRSFSELGRPHLLFELTSRTAVEPRIGSEPGSLAAAILFERPAPAAVASTVVVVKPPEATAVIAETRVAPAAQATEATRATETSPASLAPTVSAPPAAPAVDAAPVPVRHEASGVPATRLAAVGLKARDGGVTILLAGDGAFTYDTFTLANPPRYVIDLPGVLNATRKKSQDVPSSTLSRVRVSQFRGGPNPVTRVVFDLVNEGAEPAIASSESGLSVMFRRPAPAAPGPKVAAVPVPAKAEAKEAKAEVAAPPANATAGSYERHETEDPSERLVPPTAAASELKAEATVAPPAASIVAPSAVAEKPVETAPQIVASSPEVRVLKADKADPPKPPGRRPKAPSSEDKALMEAAEALLNQQQEGSKGSRELQSAFETKTLGAGERQYTGDPITLNLKDADIKDTLLRFSELTQLNIVLDPDVRGTVTISLQDIPWDQALELILRINQLGYVIEGNVMRIASTAKLAQEESGRLAFLRAQDQSRPLKTVLQKVSYAEANAIAGTAKKVMSARGDILVDARSNTLIIKELPDYLPTVLDLIKNLDTANPQVMIETRIVEATRTFSQSLGITWSFSAKADAAHGNTTGLIFPNNASILGAVALPSGGPQVLAISAGNVLDTFRLDASIHAAEARGLVKVVSTPKVQTQTGETASIQSGFQIPVQTTVNNTTTVLYINATLRLDVTPHITTEGTIIMDVTVQKREPAAGINIAQGQNIPLTTRDAKTRLMVRDGGTAVIGGIFKLTTNDSQSMIPGLWRIPLIGNLFRSRDLNDTSDELMIFITPRIIR